VRIRKVPDYRKCTTYEEIEELKSLKIPDYPKIGIHAYSTANIPEGFTTVVAEQKIAAIYSKGYLRANLVKKIKPLLLERLRLHQLHKKYLAEVVILFPALRGRSLCINNWIRNYEQKHKVRNKLYTASLL